MAFEGIQSQGRWSFPAGANLTQFTFVKLNSSGQVVPCAAVTDRPIGVVQNNPNTGDTASVCGIGITKLVTGSAASSGLAIGQTIGTDASGDALAITVGTDTTKYLVGVVVGASSAPTEFVSAWINCPSAGRAA